MRNIEVFQIDAFTDKVFHGNPATVCLLKEWLNDELLQAIATENPMSETAFVVEQKKIYHIRWFTPNGELDLGGHATLAAGFVLLELGKVNQPSVDFLSSRGPLKVTRKNAKMVMDYPMLPLMPAKHPEILHELLNQAGETFFESELDYVIVMADEARVMSVEVNLQALSLLPKRGLILTAASKDADFYSRCFFPKYHIMEDPVTGSAYSSIASFWAERLKKNKLTAIQGSCRKGEVICEIIQDRILISGYCRWYMKGHLVL